MDTNEIRKEQSRVRRVTSEVKNQIKTTLARYQRAHQATRSTQKNYGANTSVNYFEVDDRIETKAELQQQRWLVSQNMETENVIRHHLQTLKQLRNSPYFGRIDVKYPKSKSRQRLYIGTASCTDQNGHFLVFDWRAPIASIYYNGTLGRLTYQAPVGKQTVNLLKKRQFLIKNGQIRNMFDTNEIVGDEMLQHVLGQKNDRVMHNIVATIQRDQNNIIRNTRNDLLVVQGAAGSGKTSAILQRIAFLLYHNRNSLNVSQILLFSPNRLFSHYISDVLPSLGEHNMRQVTLADFLSRRLEGLDVQTIFNRYENKTRLSENQIKIRKFKNSYRFMKLLKKYCLKLDSNHIAFSAIWFNSRLFFGTETIKTLYASMPNTMMIEDKFLHVKNQLILMLKSQITVEAEKPWVQERVDNLSNEQFNQLFINRKINHIKSAGEERHFIAEKIAKRHLKKVYNAIFNDNFFDPYVQYRDFLKQVPLPKSIQKADWQKSIHRFDQNLELHQIKLDNVAPLLYLRDLITGGGKNHDIKDLFIDEMQDYSVAQLMYIKHAFPKAKLNLIGDSEQALFSKIEAPRVILQKLNQALSTRNPKLIILRRSYRSTYQITNFAKALLPDGNQIKAFNRNGPLPKIIVRDSKSQAIKATLDVIHNQLQENDTVAILTKRKNESKQLYQELYPKLKNLTLMSDRDRSLPTGVLIMPVYLAKGLEFDSVIAWNVSKKNYPQSSLLGTLYTIVTRAMHSLNLISIGSVSPLITNARINSKEFTIDRQINQQNRN